MKKTVETFEVEPCPFCGERVNLEVVDYDDEALIECECCQANGPSAPDVESAVNQWNIRERFDA